MTDPILERLNDYFKNTPREQVEKDWNDLSKWGKVGQSIDEFFKAMNDHIAYTKTLRYRMRMKKKPIRGKEILNRLNNR